MRYCVDEHIDEYGMIAAAAHYNMTTVIIQRTNEESADEEYITTIMDGSNCGQTKMYEHERKEGMHVVNKADFPSLVEIFLLRDSENRSHAQYLRRQEVKEMSDTFLGWSAIEDATSYHIEQEKRAEKYETLKEELKKIRQCNALKKWKENKAKEAYFRAVQESDTYKNTRNSTAKRPLFTTQFADVKNVDLRLQDKYLQEKQ